MKLYEAIASIINEFGKEIVTNAKVINVFSDYNAFEESKTFKVPREKLNFSTPVAEFFRHFS